MNEANPNTNFLQPELKPSKRKVKAIAFTNRKAHQYFIHLGVTKTGKPKFYVSRKAEGAMEQMPIG